jgi:hypothetical protein
MPSTCTRSFSANAAYVALALSFAVAPTLHSETAKPSSSVANAVGINTHFGATTSTYYTQSDIVIGLLQQMGVRHYRDGVTYLGNNASFPSRSFAIFNELGRLNIEGDYILSCSLTPAQNAQILAQINNVEAVEYPNEYDVSGDSNWVTTLKTCGSQLGPAVSVYPGLQLVGPSLVQMTSPAALGVVPMTSNNLHAYFDNYPPDLNYPIGSQQGPNAGGGPCMKATNGEWDCFPGLLFLIDNVQVDGPGKPVWITETGYQTSGNASTPGIGQYVPAQYEPSYFVREILWALNSGVPRTYFYALIDDPGQAYGLVNASLQPKPAFYALTSLIRLMSDPGQWNGSPADLQFSLNGGDRFLMHSLFQKSDGSFYLALWLAESDWNGAQDITPAPESISISIPGHTILTTELMQSNGVFLPTTINLSTLTIPIGTSPIFLRIM